MAGSHQQLINQLINQLEGVMELTNWHWGDLLFYSVSKHFSSNGPNGPIGRALAAVRKVCSSIPGHVKLMTCKNDDWPQPSLALGITRIGQGLVRSV